MNINAWSIFRLNFLSIIIQIYLKTYFDNFASKGAFIYGGIVIPKLISVIPSFILGFEDIILISWLKANINPPAKQWPFIQAIEG